MSIIKNSLYNSVSWIVNILLGIVTVPIFVSKLGNELYGIYVLIIGLIGYYSLIDLGLGQAIIKYVAEYKAKEDYESIFYFVSSSIILNLFLGIISSLFLVFFSRGIINLLNIPIKYYDETIWSIRIISLGFLFSLIATNFTSVFQGFQNYKITSLLNILTNILIYSISICWLYLGKGIIYIILTYTAVYLILAIIYFFYFNYNYPMWSKYFTFKWEYLKKLFSFSVFYFFSKILNIVSNYLIQFIISFVINPLAVTYYVIPRKLTNSVAAIMGSSTAVIMPKVSELEGKNDQIGLIDKYWLSNKIISGLSFPIFIAFIFFSKEILIIWVGKDLAEKTHFIFEILSIQTLIGVLTIVPNNFMMGLGKTKIQGFFSLITVIFTIIIVPIFTHYWNVNGTTIGLLVCTFPGIILVLHFNKKILGISNKEFIFEIFKDNYLVIIIYIFYSIFNLVFNIQYIYNLLFKFGLIFLYFFFHFLAFKREKLYFKILLNGYIHTESKK